MRAAPAETRLPGIVGPELPSEERAPARLGFRLVPDGTPGRDEPQAWRLIWLVEPYRPDPAERAALPPSEVELWLALRAMGDAAPRARPPRPAAAGGDASTNEQR